MKRTWVFASMAFVGCSNDPVLPDAVIDVRLAVETPVVREGETLEAELLVIAVGYVVAPGGSILYSDTVAISVEPAST